MKMETCYASTAKKKVLFFCTDNACRSQMAEGWARRLKSIDIEPFSAGSKPHNSVDPLAIRAMAEAGVDISGHHPKPVGIVNGNFFDLVVTVCNHAIDSCPVLPASTHTIHAGFDDPPRLASFAKNEEEALCHYRRVRDEIRTFVEEIDRHFR
jgi:arsenate reductase